MVREKSGKSQGILLYSDCGHPVTSDTLLYLKIAYFNNFKQLFSKTTEGIVVKFHLKYDQTLGFQNYKFG